MKRWKVVRAPLIILMLGLFITAVIAQASHQRDVSIALKQLSVDAEKYSSTLISEVNRSVIVLETLGSFFSVGNSSRSAFFAIAKDSLEHYPELLSVTWIPYVKNDQRAAFEKSEQQHSPEFEFLSFVDDKLQRSPERQYYYPFYYQYGQPDSDRSAGYDLASSKFIEMLDRSRISGSDDYLIDIQPRFFQAANERAGTEYFLVIFIPVNGRYQAANGPNSQNSFKGFLMGAIRLEGLLTRYHQSDSYQHLDISVLDISSNNQTLVVALQEDIDGGSLVEQYEHTTTIDVLGGRKWQFNVTPSQHYIDSLSQKHWRFVVSIGTLLSMMLASYLYNLRTRESVVEALVEKQTAELRGANIKLGQLSRTDSLTQLANRRYFDEYLKAEWLRAQRENQPLSLLLCDVDYFKSYNDHYGHLEGDHCLKHVALALRGCFTRSGDLVARYGGEEFAVVIPNTELTEDGKLEKCRAVIEGLKIPHEGSPVLDYVTISIGACTVYPSAELEIDDIISAADQALYRAKLEGRNRIMLFDVPK